MAAENPYDPPVQQLQKLRELPDSLRHQVFWWQLWGIVLCGCFVGLTKIGIGREIEYLLNLRVLITSVSGNWLTWLGVVLGGVVLWKIPQWHSTYLQGSFFRKELRKETNRIFIDNKEPEQFEEAIRQSERFWMLEFVFPVVFANLNLALFIQAKSVFSLGTGLILVLQAIHLFPTKARLIEMAEERLKLLRLVHEQTRNNR